MVQGRFQCTHKSGQEKFQIKLVFKTNAMVKGDAIPSKYIVTLVEEHSMKEWTGMLPSLL